MDATEIKASINSSLHTGEGEITAISVGQPGRYITYRITVSDGRPGVWKAIGAAAYRLHRAYVDADARGSKTGTLKIKAS
jgi:hypothetical protein